MRSTEIATIENFKQELLNYIEKGTDISDIQVDLKLSGLELFNLINCGANILAPDSQIVIHREISNTKKDIIKNIHTKRGA